MADKQKQTSIGGQAVIEGVMMRGKTAMVTAVRAESGEIAVEAKRITPPEKLNKALKLPLIRGVYSFFWSLVAGTRILSRSATVFGDDGDGKFKELSGQKKSGGDGFATFLGVALGLLLSIFLFFFLPQWIIDLTPLKDKTGSLAYSAVEGLIRIGFFILYILFTSIFKDIRRTYMYHGAEHKTISCYESGDELTVENVRKHTRIHDRCGTTFMFLVMTVSILIFALTSSVLIKLGLNFGGVGGKALRFGVKLLLLPVVAGVSYEILKLLAKIKGKWSYIIKAPGLALQFLTTREPDDGMIEVAITAFNLTLEMDNDESIPERTFEVNGTVKSLTEKVKTLFKKNNIDDADAEWLVALTLNIPRSKVYDGKTTVTSKTVDKVANLAAKRVKGEPLQYVLNSANFYGYDFYVDNRVLIPRPETEEVVNYALKFINETSEVLDMCTGSGAIAVTVAKSVGCKVVAADFFDGALEVAKKNATDLNATVEFVKSDKFSDVTGVFDVIISNPPYVKTGDIAHLQKECSFEPYAAFDGGEDGLSFYRDLTVSAKAHLKKGGLLIYEAGAGEAQAVGEICLKNGYKDIEIVKDINGIERIVKAVKNDD